MPDIVQSRYNVDLPQGDQLLPTTPDFPKGPFGNDVDPYAAALAKISKTQNQQSLTDILNVPFASGLKPALRYNDPNIGYHPFDDKLEYKYADAHPWQTAGNNILQFGARFGGAFVESIATIPLVINAAIDKDFSKLYDNDLTNPITEWLDDLSTTLPTYTSEYEDNHPLLKYLNPFKPNALLGAWGGAVNNLGYTAGAIAGALVEDAIIGFATGGIGLGGAIAANGVQLSKGIAKLTKAVAKGEDLIESVAKTSLSAERGIMRVPQSERALMRLNEVGALAQGERGLIRAEGTGMFQNAGRIDDLLNTGTHARQGAVNRIFTAKKITDGVRYHLGLLTSATAEGAFEAAEVYHRGVDDLKQEFFDRYGRDAVGNELDVIKETSKEAGNITMGANIALLYISNRVNWGSLFKPTSTNMFAEGITGWGKNIARSSAKGKITDVVDAAGNVINKSVAYEVLSKAPATRLGKILLNGEKLAKIGSRSINESIEEGSQFTFSEGTLDYAKSKYDPYAMQEGASLLKGLKNGFDKTINTNEGWDNMVGGFIGGILGGGIMGRIQKKTPIDEQLRRQVEMLNGVNFNGVLQERFKDAIAQNVLAGKLDEAVKAKDMFAAKNAHYDMLFNWVNSGMKANGFEKRMAEIEMIRDLTGKDFKDKWGLDDTEENRAKANTYLDGMRDKANLIKKNVEKVQYITKNPFSSKDALNYGAYETYKDELAHNLSAFEEYKARINGMTSELKAKYPLMDVTKAVNLTSVQGLSTILQQINKTNLDIANQLKQAEGNPEIEKQLIAKKEALDSIYSRIQKIVYSGNTQTSTDSVTGNPTITGRTTDVQFNGADFLGALGDLYDLHNGTSFEQNRYVQKYTASKTGDITDITGLQSDFETDDDVKADLLEKLQDIYKLSDANYNIGKYYTYLRKGVGATDFMQRIKDIAEQAARTINSQETERYSAERETAIREEEYIAMTPEETDEELTPTEEKTMRSAAKKVVKKKKLSKEEEDVVEKNPNVFTKYVKTERIIESRLKEEGLEPEETADDGVNVAERTDAAKENGEAPSEPVNAENIVQPFSGIHPRNLFGLFSQDKNDAKMRTNLFTALFKSSTSVAAVANNLTATFTTDVTPYSTAFTKIPGTELFRQPFQENLNIYHNGEHIGILRPVDGVFLDNEGNRSIYDMTEAEYVAFTGNQSDTYATFMESIKAQRDAYNKLKTSIQNNNGKVDIDVITTFFDLEINPGTRVQSTDPKADIKLGDLNSVPVGTVLVSLNNKNEPTIVNEKELNAKQLAKVNKFIKANMDQISNTFRYVLIVPILGEYRKVGIIVARNAETTTQERDEFVATLKQVASGTLSEDAANTNLNKLANKFYITVSRENAGTYIDFRFDANFTPYVRVFNREKNVITEIAIDKTQMQSVLNYEELIKLINDSIRTQESRESTQTGTLKALNITVKLDNLKRQIPANSAINKLSELNDVIKLATSSKDVFENYTIRFDPTENIAATQPVGKQPKAPTPVAPVAPAAPVVSPTVAPVLTGDAKVDAINAFFAGIGVGVDVASQAKIRTYVERILAGENRDTVLQGLGKSFTDPVDALVAQLQPTVTETTTPENVTVVPEEAPKQADGATYVKNKTALLYLLKDLFGLTKTQAEATANIYGRVAQQWAARTGKKVEDFFKQIGFSKTLPTDSKDILNQIIGELGVSNLEDANNIMNNLGLAKLMNSRKIYSRSQIRMATGWELSGDSKWRYEIADDYVINTNAANKIYSEDNKDNIRLSDLIGKDAKILKAYPLLDIISVVKNNGTSSYFNSGSNTIGIASTKFFSSLTNKKLNNNIVTEASKHAIKLSLIHEIQHAIQEIEGFPSGANPSMFFDQSKRFDETLGQDIYDENVQYDMYRREAGEVEARNVQARLNYSDVERIERTLNSTEDIDEESKVYIEDTLNKVKNDISNPIQAVIKGFELIPKYDNSLFVGFTKKGLAGKALLTGINKWVKENNIPIIARLNKTYGTIHLVNTSGQGRLFQNSALDRAIELINQDVIKGYTAAIIKDAVANNDRELLIQYLSDIADQANDVQSVDAAVRAYGQELVDIAKSLNPINTTALVINSSEVKNSNNKLAKQGIRGKLFNEKQSIEIEKEIKAGYNTNIVGKNNLDIRKNMYSYNYPLFQKVSNGVDLRIAQGFIRNKEITYLLYADGKVVGEFYSPQDAKAVVKYIESNLINKDNNLLFQEETGGKQLDTKNIIVPTYTSVLEKLTKYFKENYNLNERQINALTFNNKADMKIISETGTLSTVFKQLYNFPNDETNDNQPDYVPGDIINLLVGFETNNKSGLKFLEDNYNITLDNLHIFDRFSANDYAGLEDFNLFDKKFKDVLLNQEAKGAFDTINKVIYGLTNPDASTGVHELAHFWHGITSGANKNTNLTDAEIQQVLDWTGHATWTRETSEMFAKGFELYLSEGNQTNDPALTPIFEKFAKWLAEVYKNIQEALGITLNNNMRTIYSNMLNSEFVAPEVKEVVQEAQVIEAAAPIVVEETTTSIEPISISINNNVDETFSKLFENYNGEVYRVTINRGNTEVGDIVAINDGTNLQVIQASITPSRQGIGIEAYRQLGNEAYKLGLTLTSDLFNRLSPEAIGLWDKLINTGEAVKGSDNYIYQEKTITETPILSEQELIDQRDKEIQLAEDEQQAAIDGLPMDLEEEDYNDQVALINTIHNDIITSINNEYQTRIDALTEPVTEEATTEVPVTPKAKRTRIKVTTAEKVDLSAYEEAPNTILTDEENNDTIITEESETTPIQYVSYTTSEGEKSYGKIIEIDGTLLTIATIEGTEIFRSVSKVNNIEEAEYTKAVDGDTIYYSYEDSNGNKLTKSFVPKYKIGQSVKDADGTTHTITGIEFIPGQKTIYSKKDIEDKENIKYVNDPELGKYVQTKTKTVNVAVQDVKDSGSNGSVVYDTVDGIRLDEDTIQRRVFVSGQDQVELKTRYAKQIKNIDNVVARLSQFFGGIQYEYVELPFAAPARFYKGVVQINLNNIEAISKNTNEILVHEFIHPFVKALQMSNIKLYDNLVKDLTNNYPAIIEEAKTYYKEKDYKATDLIDEALTLHLGRAISTAFAHINDNARVSILYSDLKADKDFNENGKHNIKYKGTIIGETLTPGNPQVLQDMADAYAETLNPITKLRKNLYIKFRNWFNNVITLIKDQKAPRTLEEFVIAANKKQQKFKFNIKSNINNSIEFEQNGTKYITVNIDPEFIKDSYDVHNVIPIISRFVGQEIAGSNEEFTEDNYNELQFIFETQFFGKHVSVNKNTFTAAKLNGNMTLEELAQFIAKQYIDGDIIDNITFTPQEQDAFDQMEAYFNANDPQLAAMRARIVGRFDLLKEIANKRLNSDALNIQVGAAYKLDLDSKDDLEFMLKYMENAAVSINMAYIKYGKLMKELTDKKGVLSRAEVNAMNKEFAVLRQLVSYYDQFSSYHQFEDHIKADKSGKSFEYYSKAFAVQQRMREGMQDLATKLTVEWLMPYATMHTKLMKEQGYTDEQYEITYDKLFKLFKYGGGKDTNYITFWLGANVTSRDPINAIFANTLGDMLSTNNIKISLKADDFAVAFSQFLKDKGLGTSSSKAQQQYYKDHYMRKAKIKTIHTDPNTKVETVKITEKWALHQEYKFDEYDIDLQEEMLKYKNPISSKQADEFKEKLENWKKAANYGKSAKYLNTDYAKIKNDPFFKAIETTYNDSNMRYGTNQLRFGIIPQKYEVSYSEKIKRAVDLFKGENKIDHLKEAITTKLGGLEKSETSYNLDGTVYRNINTTLSTIKDEENISIALEEILPAFIVESNNYSTLKETQYNAETIMLLLEGNTKLSIAKRTFAQEDFNSKITQPFQLKQAEDKIKELEDMKIAGDPAFDQKLLDSLRDKVAKGVVSYSLWDKISKHYTPNDSNKNNEMLLGMIKDRYFGESVEEVKIGKISATKAAHYLRLYTSINNMAGNYVAGLGNITIGNTQLFIEAHGGMYMNKATLGKAQLDYIKNIPEYVKDLQRPIKSKDTQLSIMLDAIQGEIEDEFGERVNGNIARKMFRTSSLFLFTKAGEHQIQLTNMKAMMLFRKVKTNKGEEISLYDAFTSDKEGRYSLRTDIQFKEEDLTKFMRDMHGVNRMLNGNYSTLHKTVLQRKWYGNLMLSYRKYLYPSIRARYASEHVDFERNTVEVGYLRDTMRYISKGIGGLISGKGLASFEKWDKLKPHQRYAMRKTGAELGMFASLTGLGIAFFGSGDDDKKSELTDAQKFGALMLTRLASDLGMYHIYMPSETIRQLKNPTASLQTVVGVFNILKQIIDNPTAIYEQKSGSHEEGDSKLKAKVLKLVPIISKFQSTLDDKLGYQVLLGRSVGTFIEGVTPKNNQP